MTITKVKKGKVVEDKTDWDRVYQKPQHVVDNEALNDDENPVIKQGLVRRINEKK